MLYCDICEKFVDELFTLEILSNDEYGKTGMIINHICYDCIIETESADKKKLHKYNVIPEGVKQECLI